MWRKLVDLLKAALFLEDEEKTRRAHVLNALHLNMGAALLVLGSAGLVFVFAEKLVATLIILSGSLITLGSMILNRLGHVKASGVVLLGTLWGATILMASLSDGKFS